MNAQDHSEQTDDDDHPVQAQEVVKLPTDDTKAPAGPSDQPPLPDFNS